MNNYTHSICICCGGAKFCFIGKVEYAENLKFSTVAVEITNEPELWCCNSCESWFIQNIFSEDAAKKFYQEGDPLLRWSTQGFSSRATPELIKSIEKFLVPNKKILDIGAGSGEFLDYAKNKGCITYGLEYSRNSRAHIKKKGHIPFSDINDIKENFDIIFAFDLVEHLYDVNEFLKKCFQVLKEGGKLVIFTGSKDSLSAQISSNNWWYIKYPEHVVFPSKKFFQNHKDFKFESITSLYHSNGYKSSFFNKIKYSVLKILRGKFDGLPSITPDHCLVVLHKVEK